MLPQGLQLAVTQANAVNGQATLRICRFARAICGLRGCLLSTMPHRVGCRMQLQQCLAGPCTALPTRANPQATLPTRAITQATLSFTRASQAIPLAKPPRTSPPCPITWYTVPSPQPISHPALPSNLTQAIPSPDQPLPSPTQAIPQPSRPRRRVILAVHVGRGRLP